VSRYWKLALSSPQQAKFVVFDFRRCALQFGSAIENYSDFNPHPDPKIHINRAASIVFEHSGRARGIEGVAREIYQRQKLPTDHDFHITEENRAAITAAINLLYRRVGGGQKFIDESGRIDIGSSLEMERARDFSFQADHYQKPASITSTPA
jgi:hypothetical protein